MAHCINRSSQDAHHPGELTWEDGHAYCPRCLRLHRAIQRRYSMASHPSSLPPVKLDMSRCHAHDFEDRLGCEHCVANREVV